MKKTVFCSMVLASAAALAGSISSSNSFGVLEVNETTKNYLLVSVPWNDFGTGSDEVNIATIVNPDQFENDANVRLYVPTEDVGTYNVYKIENNAWAACKTAVIEGGVPVEQEATSPFEATVARGQALWLYRPDNLKAVKPILLGQAPAEATASASVSVAVGMNLVGVSSVVAKQVSAVTGAAAGDQIIVPGNGGADICYQYLSGSTRSGRAAGWYKQQAVGGVSSWVAVTDGDTLPPGQGFWYNATVAGTLSL